MTNERIKKKDPNKRKKKSKLTTMRASRGRCLARCWCCSSSQSIFGFGKRLHSIAEIASQKSPSILDLVAYNFAFELYVSDNNELVPFSCW
jgi:hypothetical protein